MNNLDKILSKVGDLNFRRRVVKMLEYLQIRKTDVVLDAGCGEGFYSMVFNKLYGCKVCGIDYDPDILRLAKNWLHNESNIEIKSADLCSIDYPDKYFDKVVCSEVLEHIIDDHKAASEIFRVMKLGGTLAVTVPNKNYPFLWDPMNKISELLGLGHFNSKSRVLGGIWSYDHKRLYSVGEIVKVLTDAGFRIEKKEVLTHYGIPFNHLLLVLGKDIYTKFPVAKKIKDSMEKFKWDESDGDEAKLPFPINKLFDVMKYIDKFNDTKFPLNKSTMAISIKAKKPD